VSRSEPSLCFLSPDTCTCSPLPSSGFRGRSFQSPAVPHLHRYYGVVRLLLHPWSDAYGLPWRPGYRSCERRWRALLGSWGIPLEACPELGTPATPARPRNSGRPDAAFRLVNSVGIAISRVFGAESSRPASLLCTLRTHQSPSEWQHSLPACVLALAVRDLHPLDSIKGFHRLIFGSSSSTLFPAR
jgi:hypothetical protein